MNSPSSREAERQVKAGTCPCSEARTAAALQARADARRAESSAELAARAHLHRIRSSEVSRPA